MSLAHRVSLVENLFEELNQEITIFNSQANLHCVSGCGKCCTKPDIDASPLEFLPWSYHLFLNGKAAEVLEQLSQKSSPICHIFTALSLTDTASGRCEDYQHRGLICRLFGYAASRDKYGQLRLATCKIIKDGQNENYENIKTAIGNGLSVPIFSDYYQKLAQIDFRLGNTIVPINEALKLAIEEVLQYYAYRPMPNGYKGAA